MPERSKSKTHQYNVIWYTKYSRKVLNTQIQTRLVGLIQEHAKQRRYRLKKIKTNSEHVQLCIEVPSTYSLETVGNTINGIKSDTAKVLRETYPIFKYAPEVWSKGLSIRHIPTTPDEDQPMTKKRKIIETLETQIIDLKTQITDLKTQIDHAQQREDGKTELIELLASEEKPTCPFLEIKQGNRLRRWFLRFLRGRKG